MKGDRLLSTLLPLQAHGKLSGREVGERLEVSMGTVHRHMEALSAGAGVGIARRAGRMADRRRLAGRKCRGRRGGSERAVDGTASGYGRPAAAAAESALRKLMAALPAAMPERAASIRQRLHVGITGWRGTGENLAMLPVVQDAVACGRAPHGTCSRGRRAGHGLTGCRGWWRRGCWMRPARGGVDQDVADGYVRVRFHHEEEACFVALGLGRRVEVMAPAKLNERVRAEVAAMAARAGVRAGRGIAPARP